VGDPQEPGPDRATRRVIGIRFAPDGNEDVLDDLLGGGTIERPRGQVEDQGGVAPVEGREGGFPPGGELAHQVLVAEGVHRWAGLLFILS